MSSNRNPVNRLLLLAGPGQGKTSLLKSLTKEYRNGGRILDPLDDFADVAGVRWDRRPEWTFAPDFDDSIDETLGEYESLLDSVEAGELLIVDEANRFAPNHATRGNLLLRFLDTARNRGAKFVLAEKRPSRLSPLTVDLATHVAFRPWRSASARNWLKAAGVDVDELPPLRMLAPSLENPWYLLRVGGDVEETNAREILRGVLDTSNLKA